MSLTYGHGRRRNLAHCWTAVSLFRPCLLLALLKPKTLSWCTQHGLCRPRRCARTVAHRALPSGARTRQTENRCATPVGCTSPRMSRTDPRWASPVYMCLKTGRPANVLLPTGWKNKAHDCSLFALEAGYCGKAQLHPPLASPTSPEQAELSNVWPGRSVPLFGAAAFPLASGPTLEGQEILLLEDAHARHASANLRAPCKQ